MEVVTIAAISHESPQLHLHVVLYIIAFRVFQRHPGSSFSGMHHLGSVANVADGSIRTSWNCLWPNHDRRLGENSSSDGAAKDSMGEDLWFLASDVMGYCPQVLCIQRVGSNVVNLLTNQIWAEHRRPRKEGFKRLVVLCWFLGVFFPAWFWVRGYDLWTQIGSCHNGTVWYGMVWHSQSNYLPSCVSLAQCSQPMMEDKCIWVRRDLLTQWCY